MKIYYKASSREGRRISGVIEANKIEDAANYLREKEYFPIVIKEVKESRLFESIPFLRNKVTRKDVIVFTRQLSLMLIAGLTLIKALEIIKNQSNKKVLKDLVENLITDVQEGASFSKALFRYPTAFSPAYISIVKASESSGFLDESLSRLADNLEKEQKLKGSIKAALTYPILVFTLMIIVVFIMMVFVVPKLSALYEELGIDLPIPTKIVVGFSEFTVDFWPIIIGILFLAVFLFKRFHKTETGRVIVDDLILKIPIIGDVVRKSVLVEVSRTLGTLIGSGTLVVESLSQTASISSNIHFQNAIEDVSKKVEKGVTVADGLSSYALFPPILVQLVRVGEQTGNIDETLLKAAEYFESEVDQALKALTSAMEPIIMVILGVGVGFLVFSIITPIYKLTSSIQ